jgi:hypothetical protein
MADKTQSFRDVVVWQKAHAFTLAVYRCSVSRLLHGYIAGLERVGT